MNTLLKNNVRLFGRTLETDNGVYFNWSGSGFEFEFKGTAAFATLYGGEIPAENDRAYIGVYVDGMPYLSARFAIDKNGEYTLAENLPFGVHRIKVIKEIATHMNILQDRSYVEPQSNP